MSRFASINQFVSVCIEKLFHEIRVLLKLKTKDQQTVKATTHQGRVLKLTYTSSFIEFYQAFLFLNIYKSDAIGCNSTLNGTTSMTITHTWIVTNYILCLLNTHNCLFWMLSDTICSQRYIFHFRCSFVFTDRVEQSLLIKLKMYTSVGPYYCSRTSSWFLKAALGNRTLCWYAELDNRF